MSNEYTEISGIGSPLLLENRKIGNRNKFCGFLVSNPSNQLRNETFLQISKYKFVESGGAVYNNIGYKVSNTLEWMTQFKFFICFENSKHDYYITEKLINAYHAGCIPIYWGSDTVSEEFNEKCFINCNKISTFGELISIINRIDNNESEYLSMLKEPLMKSNIYDSQFNSQNLLEIISSLIK
jgi:hypothetical protein